MMLVHTRQYDLYTYNKIATKCIKFSTHLQVFKHVVYEVLINMTMFNNNSSITTTKNCFIGSAEVKFH